MVDIYFFSVFFYVKFVEEFNIISFFEDLGLDGFVINSVFLFEV